MTALLVAPATAFGAARDISTVAGISGSPTGAGDGGPATSASLMNPLGVGVGPDGATYVADYGGHKVRRISPAGTITTFAGDGIAGLTGDGGAATSARLRNPSDVAVDALGNVYIADAGNHRIRVVSPGGTISNYAGTTSGYLGDNGPATAARLNAPHGIDVDAAGNVYVADFNNNRVRKISGGTITTVAGTGVAGSGGDGGAATSATLNAPSGVAVDQTGILYIAEYDGNRVRKVGTSGTITRFAGTGGGSTSGDGGLATNAQLNAPWGVETDSDGNVYVTEIGGHVTRKVSWFFGIISRYAGTGSAGFSGDGGTASSAQLNGPAAMQLSSAGHLYIADYTNRRVRRVEAVAKPEAPTVGAVSPASPSNVNNVTITGTAPLDTTVRLYTDSACNSSVAGSGTAAAYGSSGIAVTVASDATTTLYATASNSLGASACSSTSVSYVEDSTPPGSPTIGTSPTTPSTGRNPSWSFSGEAATTLECKLVRGTDTIENWTTCSTSKAYNLTGEADGTYTFSVRAKDAANNTGAAATSNYVLDTTAPGLPTIDAKPASPGNDLTPEWGWTGEGDSYRCRLESNGIELQAWSPCSSAHGYDLTGKPDGAYLFQVHARDAAGNDGQIASHTYTLNTALPATPTITVSQSSPGSTRSPQWTFGTSQGGVTLECRLDRGVDEVYAWEPCTTSHSFDLTGEPNGTYLFSVRADNGVTQGAPASAAYTLDTVAPGDPTFPSAPASPDLDEIPEWSLAASGGATRFECRLMRGTDTIATRTTCTSPASWDLSAEVDGTYVLESRAFDAAGNASGWSSSTGYALDTTAPADPTVSAPASPSSDGTPTWTFAAAGATGYECRVERGGLEISDWATCASPWEYDLAGKPDGVYTVLIRSRDAVGNRSDGASSTYEVQRSVPATPSITASPGPLGRTRSVQWSFSTSETGMTFECRLARGGTEIEPWDSCTSPQQYDLTGEDDGAYTFSLRAKNGVNTLSDPTTSDYELDTAAPPAPSVGSEPAAVGSGRAPAWSFTAESGATVRCRVTLGATEIDAYAACTSPHTVDLSGRDDGVYTLTLFARDLAGNDSPTTTRTYELDTTGPAAPSFTSTERTPGNVRLPSWTWTGSGTFECSLARPGGATDDWAACTSPTARDLGGQPDGRYELRVRGVDTAGNRGAIATAGYELDTQPGSLALTGGPSPLLRDPSATFAWSGEAGASFRCRTMRGGDVRTDWAPCSSPHEVDLAGDSDGAYTFAVSATDTAGNASPDAAWTFSIDRTPPAAATYDEKPPARAKDRTPSWTFASDPGARYECRVEEGTNTVFDWRECVSPYKVDLRDREDATYSLLVRAIDEAGNVAAPTETSYRLDTTPPAAPELTDKPNSNGLDRTPTWAFRGESRSELECRLKEDGKDAPDWRACESPKTYDLESKDDGAYTFFVRARDLAGNNGEPASDLYRLRAEAKAAGNDGGGSSGSGDPAPGPGSEPAAPTPAAPGPGDPLPAATPESPGDDPDDAAGDDEDESDAMGGGAAGRGGAGAGPGNGGPAAAGTQGAGGAGAGGDEDGKRRKKPGNAAQETFKKVGKVVAAIAEEPAKTAFPMSLIFIVSGFMGLQGRIDRNDPKLALAPVFADPDLEFKPPRDARAAVGDQ